MVEAPDIFVDLLDATMRSARNYHRLDHCSLVAGTRPTTGFRFKEETITDLLVGELAGRQYDVTAACPVCGPGTCADWDGDPSCAVNGFQVRALTRHEEGGTGRGRAGAHADFILTIRRQDPGGGGHRPGGPELRIMVQAKRADPRLAAFRPNRAQYSKLAEIAPAYGAVPYYALYVQQPGAHDSAPTACPRALSAADRSVVLAAARAPVGSAALPGRPLAAILGEARPLRCLVGCTCADPAGSTAGAPDPGSVWNTALSFITRDFPGYKPVSSGRELPPGVPAVRTNLSQYKPPGTGPKSRRRPGSADASARHLGDGEVLLIRLGAQRASPTPDRRFIGYAPGMSAGELRDSARMYWRLGGERARRVRYLVISASRRVLDACEVIPDGLTFVEGADGRRRVAFTVATITTSGLRHRLMALAERRLSQLPAGARNPCVYLPGDSPG